MKKQIQALIGLLIFCQLILYWLNIYSISGNLSSDIIFKEPFRKMELKEQVCCAIGDFSDKTGEPFADVLSVYMITVRFCGNWIPDWDFKEYQHKKKLLMRYHRKAFDTVRDAYRAVFSDVCVFPIAGFSLADFSFEDSWGEQREYGGTRSHEGTDLFGKSTLPGFYPLLSVCDGTVDKIGWLPLGGYRIGIRGSSGGYYYYAHLDSYAQDFQIGQQVAAGEMLGLMGNSGYGPEGTKGKFPVHLHFGIYITASNNQEISVNPYALLKYRSKKIKKYTF